MAEPIERTVARVKEQVEGLTGERGAKLKPMAAIRRGELLALAARPLLSEQAQAAPTMEQHNALQADVKAIFDALAVISNALGTARML